MPALSTPSIIVNNVPIPIKPNSFSYTEGFGDRGFRIASAGGGSKTGVTSEDVSTQMSTIKFTLFTTDGNVALARQWAALGNANTIQAADGAFTRAFASAIITNDYEVAAGVDGEFELEFKSLPAA